MTPIRYILTSLGLLTTVAAASLEARAQANRAAAPWQDAPAARAAVGQSHWAGRLARYRPVAANTSALAALLATAPPEGTGGSTILTLPTPDGGTAQFRIFEAPVMEAALAAQYPQIKTYAGIGLDDPTATLRADLTPQGFHAQVLSREEGRTFYIDPVDFRNPALGAVSYWRQDLTARAGQAPRTTCQVVTGPNGGWLSGPAPQAPAGTANRIQTALGGTLRTYRLALAATGEYTAAVGGTATAALAAMTTSVNRVTGVYEKELGVRLVLVANTNLLIYTNASTDPYTNNNGSTMLGQNQTNITTVIGSANYDIGHVFSTGGGGVAGLGVVCNTSNKARGVTGSSTPTGDGYDIDYVAHEIGHQFGGNHPFNGSVGSCTGANRNGTTAWEPGSGSTIMAYAGICDGSALGSITSPTGSQDLQRNSDAYFHGGNISEMTTFINSTTCAVSASSGNTPPTVSTPVNKSIPASTPFMLTGSATDADGDALTYAWEEMDLGAQGAPVVPSTTQTANSTLPLFRSWSPTTNPVRYFPRLNELRNNTVAYGEALPTVARSLNFRLTVRDQHFSTALGRIVGGINQSNTLTLTVVNTGAAFAVTAPNTAVSVAGGASSTVTWNVAGTTAAPISCATVNILLSTDGGLTFPTTLASNVANSGTASVAIPNTPTSTARIMVQAADNYFFDISNANFTITAGTNSPTITSFTPASGAAGTSVTITGTNFTGATALSFNGTAATFTVVNATTLTATVPAGAVTGLISVTTPNGTGSSATAFTVPAPPTLTSFSPASGAVGTSVTLTGNNFTGATAVSFNGTAATFTVVNATTLTTTVPASATTGPLSVTTALGTATSATSFTVVAAPANDLCTAPNLPVLQCGASVTGTTTLSTSTGDPTGTCGTSIDATSGGVFYRLLGTGGSITLSTCNAGTNYDTKLFVYSGTCGALTCVGGNDDQTGTCAANGSTTPSVVTFTSVAGTNYYVFVSGYSGATGNFVLTTTCAPSTITGFSPTAGLEGSSVNLTGTLLATASGVSFNGTPATAFTVNSATSVTATVPTGATNGPVTVTTNAGTATSAGSFTVLHPPVITNQAFTIAENSAAGAVVGTVVATDVDAGQTLTYAITGGNTGNTFTFVGSALQVNAGAALDFEALATYNLTVQVTDNGSPATSATATVTVNLSNVNEAPSVNPQAFTIAENAASGTVVGTVTATDPDAGTALAYTITGGNTGGAFAFVGNQLQVSAASLNFEALPSYTLSVEVSDGSLLASTTLTVSLTNVVETPTISALSPNSGGIGTSVTITGTNFTAAGAPTVTFNTTTATAVTVNSATSLTATVPTGATSGFVAVTNADGTGTSTTAFSVITGPAPTATTFAPSSGVVGVTVTLRGTNFTGATGVFFNGVPASSFTVVSATTITAVVSAAATTGKISVTTPGGTAQTGAIFKVLPQLTGFTPGNGAPGMIVTLTGTGFADATSVKFNTVVTTGFTIVSPTTIEVAVPALATTGRIAVTNPGGTATSTATFTVAPIITGFLPAQGAPGSIVLVQGINFLSGTTAKVNATTATAAYNSATQLTVTVPAGATSGPISATNANGTGSSAASYTVVTGTLPTITSFTPTANVIAGTVITLTGTNFTGATLVRFNNVNATSFTVNSATSITATVPAGALTGRVYVATPAGMCQSTSSLTIIAPPTITALTPAAGAPGSVVLIAGTNLTGASGVTFNGLPAASFTVNSSVQIAAVVPAGATSGKISVTTIAGTATSATSFTVLSGLAPTITALSPTSGLRGSTVVVTGTNFTGVTTVKLGTSTVAATAYTVNSATQLTLTVPSTAVSGVIYITTSGGGMAQSPVSFTVILAPTVTTFTPATGPVGTLVTINGTNFLNTTGVAFGGVPATSYTIVTATRITATVPAGALTGTISVTNAAGTANSAGTFTVIGARTGGAAFAKAAPQLPVELTVFPNPATAWATVQVSGGNAETATATVEILDATGRIVRRAALTSGTVELPLQGLTTGLYTVRAAGKVQRLVVE